MTRSHLKLAADAPSPERQALADAIEAAGPLRVAADKARRAAEAARGALAAALEAGPAAERAADAARARAVEDPTADRGELRALRQAVTDAADDLAIARDVAERAEAALIEAERAVRYAEDRIGTAADAVIASAYPVALDAAQCAGREAAGSAFRAEFIAASADPWNGERSRRLGEAAALNGPIRFGGTETSAIEAARQAAQAPWRAARAALLTDSATPLPLL